MKSHLLLSLSALLVAGCTEKDPIFGPPANATAVAFTNISSPVATYWYSGGRFNRERLVVSDASQWTGLWASITSNVSPPPAAPEIDFTTSTALVAASGGRPTGGYSISIDGVSEAEGVLYVQVRETSPGPSCTVTQATTSPVSVVTVPRRNMQVVFIEKTEVHNCI